MPKKSTTKEAKAEPAVNPFVEKFVRLRDTALKFAVGDDQERLVELLILAILSREHGVVVGPPGCNKTGMIDVVAHLLGCNVRNRAMAAGEEVNPDDPYTFYVTLDKYSEPESLFGPFDPRELKQNGRWVRNLENTLADAHVAFIGEVFSANGATLRSLVRALNERQVEQGGVRKNIPLVSLFADTNHYPHQHLDAVYDRFLLRMEAGYLPSNDRKVFQSMLKVDKFEAKDHAPILSLSELETIHGEVDKVKVPKDTYSVIFDLRTGLLGQEVTLSDRRWKRCIQVLKAAAYLRGRDTVSDPDYYVLRHILWSDPDMRHHTDSLLAPYKFAYDAEAAGGSASTSDAPSGDSDSLRSAELVFQNAISSKNPGVLLRAVVTVQDTLNDASDEATKNKLMEMSNKLTEALASVQQ